MRRKYKKGAKRDYRRYSRRMRQCNIQYIRLCFILSSVSDSIRSFCVLLWKFWRFLKRTSCGLRIMIANFLLNRIHVINIVLRRLIFWCLQNGSCSMRTFWAQAFWGGFKNFGKIVPPYLFVNIFICVSVFDNLKPLNLP